MNIAPPSKTESDKEESDFPPFLLDPTRPMSEWDVLNPPEMSREMWLRGTQMHRDLVQEAEAVKAAFIHSKNLVISEDQKEQAIFSKMHAWEKIWDKDWSAEAARAKRTLALNVLVDTDHNDEEPYPHAPDWGRYFLMQRRWKHFATAQENTVHGLLQTVRHHAPEYGDHPAFAALKHALVEYEGTLAEASHYFAEHKDILAHTMGQGIPRHVAFWEAVAQMRANHMRMTHDDLHPRFEDAQELQALMPPLPPTDEPSKASNAQILQAAWNAAEGEFVTTLFSLQGQATTQMDEEAGREDRALQSKQFLHRLQKESENFYKLREAQNAVLAQAYEEKKKSLIGGKVRYDEQEKKPVRTQAVPYRQTMAVMEIQQRNENFVRESAVALQARYWIKSIDTSEALRPAEKRALKAPLLEYLKLHRAFTVIPPKAKNGGQGNITKEQLRMIQQDVDQQDWMFAALAERQKEEGTALPPDFDMLLDGMIHDPASTAMQLAAAHHAQKILDQVPETQGKEISHYMIKQNLRGKTFPEEMSPQERSAWFARSFAYVRKDALNEAYEKLEKSGALDDSQLAEFAAAVARETPEPKTAILWPEATIHVPVRPAKEQPTEPLNDIEPEESESVTAYTEQTVTHELRQEMRTAMHEIIKRLKGDTSEEAQAARALIRQTRNKIRQFEKAEDTLGKVTGRDLHYIQHSESDSIPAVPGKNEMWRERAVEQYTHRAALETLQRYQKEGATMQKVWERLGHLAGQETQENMANVLLVQEVLVGEVVNFLAPPKAKRR